jgi:hypothetical protein
MTWPPWKKEVKVFGFLMAYYVPKTSAFVICGLSSFVLRFLVENFSRKSST